MSYETNPNLNRIKVIKGWKNPNFPSKSLDYSQEVILWFKVYIFLKVYLWYQNIRLLACEMRLSEFNNKLLYLSITKNIPKKKNVKSKWKTKSFLQILKSPLTKRQNKKARFLLYRDLKTLKTKTEFFLNTHRNKILTKAWISKPRFSSWINFSHNIHLKRQFSKKKSHIIWKKKKNDVLKVLLKLKYKGSQSRFRQLKKELVSGLAEKKHFLWKNTQKNLFSIIIKLHKDVLFLETFFEWLTRISLRHTKKSFQKLIIDLTKRYQWRKEFLKEVQSLYERCLKITKTEISLTTFSQQFAIKLSQQKNRRDVENFWLSLKKQSKIFQSQIFFHSSKKKYLSLIRSRFWKKTLKNNFVLFFNHSKKTITLRQLSKQSLRPQVEKILWNNRRLSLQFLPKVRQFKKPLTFRKVHLFGLLRFEQKKQRHIYEKKKGSKFSSKVNSLPITRDSTTQKLAYRLSFRSNYRTHLTLTTNLKLKYLIENIINQYFSFVVCVKLFWPLMQFKNLKFYRLIFPEYKQFNRKKKNAPWTINKNLRLQKKKYFYIGQHTNHIQLQEQIRQSNQKLFQIKKLNSSKESSKNFLLNNIDYKKNYNKKKDMLSSLHPRLENIRFSIHNRDKILSNFWQQKIIKKNKYLKLKAKVIQSQSEKRLFWASKEPFISNLITTLTLFTKYLNPQPLADHLAKIIGSTKKHASILKLIKILLKTLHFKRGVGYRIALIGRINGANKSRTLYLKKLNRNRPRQTFSKNVNFAMSQARATIGAFGVKIWVYS
jgi:hypothetical protein